jgi:hypothetical protein
MMQMGAKMPEKKKQEPKVKLKQVHWVKVNDRKIKDTVWEKMKDDEVDIDKDEIEILFAMKESGKPGVKDPSGAGEGGDDLVGPNGQRKKRVVILLSANRSQTIGVLLSHLKVSAPILTFSYYLFTFYSSYCLSLILDVPWSHPRCRTRSSSEPS